MATCGYLCPACEGRGYNENGQNCTWCTDKEVKPVTDEEWIANVHQGPCCGDLSQKKEGD